jgi:hypothetical protein
MKWILCISLAGFFAAGCSSVSTQPLPLQSVVYHNTQYGLTFFLPPNWQGYSVLTQQWTGNEYDEKLDRPGPVVHGPMIVLRHPHWAPDNLHQDIPILVFTRQQWKEDAGGGGLGIYAGGYESELSHNSKYVFAINDRFNWAEDLNGCDEANDIIAENTTASPLLPVP